MSASTTEITGWEPVPKGQLELTIVPLAHLALAGVVDLSDQQACKAIGWAPHTIAGIALSKGHIALSYREKDLDLIKDRSFGMTYKESAEAHDLSVQTQKNRGASLIGRMRAGSMGGVISRTILMPSKRLYMEYSAVPLEVPLTPQQQLLACGLVLGLTDGQIADQLHLSVGPINQWKASFFSKQAIVANDRHKRDRATRWLYERRLFAPVPPAAAEGLLPGRIPDVLIEAAGPLVTRPGRKRAVRLQAA